MRGILSNRLFALALCGAFLPFLHGAETPLLPAGTPVGQAGGEASGLGPSTSVGTHEPELPGETTGLGPAISLIPHVPRVARPPRNWIDQTNEQVLAKSVGCLECHKTTDALSMHKSPNVVLGCTDCHGGNAARGLAASKAHVQPRNPEYWRTSANPVNASVLLNHESPEFILFNNPGDLRVAKEACGLCHGEIVRRVQNSMMNHGTMLWSAAAYNNGAINLKDGTVGMAYGADGIALTLNNPFKPTVEETRIHGWLGSIVPLMRFARSMPGNVFRIFEKGGEEPLSIGLPTQDEPPGEAGAPAFRAWARDS